MFPAEAADVAQYLADHAESHALTTLQRRLIAIGVMHRSLGVIDPGKSQLVRATLRGIKRVKGCPPRRALPLLHSDLEQAFQKPATLLSTIRDRALLLVGFAGALRRSELVGIDVEHVRFCEGGLMLTIPRSKTDPYKIGRSIFIAARPGNGCAVSTLQGLFSGDHSRAARCSARSTTEVNSETDSPPNMFLSLSK